jgi:hypothetical protein
VASPHSPTSMYQARGLRFEPSFHRYPRDFNVPRMEKGAPEAQTRQRADIADSRSKVSAVRPLRGSERESISIPARQSCTARCPSKKSP